MSGNFRIIIITIVLLISSIGCAKQNQGINTPNPKEDLLIMLALDSEKFNNFQNTFQYYQELYNLTNKKIYLFKAISYGLKTNSFEQIQTLIQQGIKQFPEDKTVFQRQYILTLTLQEKYKEALVIAKKLLKEDPSAISYELVAHIYYSMKEYKQALSYYESAYSKNKNEDTLIKLTNILYNYLKKKDTALAYLETYIQTNKCSSKICDKLLLIYQEQGNVDGMLSILTRVYNRYKHLPQYKNNTLAIQKLIISLLEKKDIKKAIKFLEETKIDPTKLINLYYQDKQLKKR